jgi:hypothetical protein
MQVLKEEADHVPSLNNYAIFLRNVRQNYTGAVELNSTHTGAVELNSTHSGAVELNSTQLNLCHLSAQQLRSKP